MRLIASFHVDEPATADLSLASVVAAKAASAFCTLSDRTSELTLAHVRSRLSHTAADKRINAPQPTEFATVVCARKAAATAADMNDDAGDAPAALFSLLSESDCSSLRDDDHLHVFFPSAWQSEDAALTFLASVRSLPALQTTFIARPLSPQSVRLAEFDRVETVECTVPRSAAEPLVSTEELARQMQAPDSAERRAYAAALLESIRSCGFLRLRFSAVELTEIRALYAMQRAYFALPLEEKQADPVAKKGSAVSDYQKAFGYSSSHACRKEFFVVRKPPKSQTEAAAAAATSSSAAAASASSSSSVAFSSPSWTLPSNPPNFGPSVFPVFARLGLVCQHLTSLLLMALGAEASKVQELLRDSMEPAQTAEANRFTSVIELFRYSVYSVGGTQTKAAAASSMDGPAAAASSSSAAAPSAASAFVPPPPLPCAIHCDASLLTLIPRCVGPAGLQLYNLSASGWQAVEAQCSEEEGIVFPGDMMQRITNGEILAASHRVAFGPQAADSAVTGATEAESALASYRYSFPFELFLAPTAVVDCASLLSLPASSLQSSCRAVLSAQAALTQLSANLVSVNKTN